MWLFYSVLSALFAALTYIFAKIGIKDVNSNVATAVRTFVVLVMAWLIVFMTGRQNEVLQIDRRSWLFLIFSGLATGLSWVFYYRALQIGDVSKVVPVDKLSVVFTMILAFAFLGEKVDVKSITGGLLLTAGILVLAL